MVSNHIFLLRLFNFGSDAYSGWEAGLGIWNDKFQEIMNVLMQAPDTIFGGKLWGAMNTIIGAFTAIGYMLIILFFYMGMTKGAFTFMEMKRTGFIMRMFTRLFITIWAVQHAGTLIIRVSNIFVALINTAINAAGINGATTLTMDYYLGDRIEKAGFVKQLSVFLISLIATVVIIVIAFRILITVYGRVFKIMLYAVLAPLALSCFASESTSSYGLSYVRAFLGVCVEGLLIALCCIIFNVYAETMPEDDAEIRAYDITQNIETVVDADTHKVTTVYTYDVTDNPLAVPLALVSLRHVLIRNGYDEYIVSANNGHCVVQFTSDNSDAELRENFVDDVYDVSASKKGQGGGIVKKFISYVTTILFMMLILAATVSICDQLAARAFGLS